MNESDIFCCTFITKSWKQSVSFTFILLLLLWWFFFFFLHKRNQTIAKKNGFTLSHKATSPTAVRENCYSETVSGSLQKGGYLHSETELCATFLSPGAEMRAGMEQFCPHPIHCVRFRNCKTPTTVRKKNNQRSLQWRCASRHLVSFNVTHYQNLP